MSIFIIIDNYPRDGQGVGVAGGLYRVRHDWSDLAAAAVAASYHLKSPAELGLPWWSSG